MTPDELRSLADEATPGPWINLHRQIYGAGASPDGVGDDILRTEKYEGGPEVRLPADARLIALAPDLARLCAELGEALGASDGLIRFLRPDLSHTRSRADWLVKQNRAALAKLSELEAR